ncbi:MAG: hypothetical protein ACJAUE_001934 [Alcanivorax sp.]|jgi:hypothetical protein|nr:hypothetical protein ADG881_1282 [Alcanivorax sp. DG881]
MACFPGELHRFFAACLSGRAVKGGGLHSGLMLLLTFEE